MSLEASRELASLVTQAGDSFIDAALAELEQFHAQAGAALLSADSVTETRQGLSPLALLLLGVLASLWAEALNSLLRDTHARLKLPAPVRYTAGEARDFMSPGVQGLVRSALMTYRVNQGTRENLKRAWERQYERGGAFTALRGSIRGATHGTLNTLTVASVIDTARDQPGDWVLGAYNPLDERTAALDWALCTNEGQRIVTARGRSVQSIPGMIGKYTFANAWLPGSPRQGGDTYDGCRCVLIPERRPR